MNKLMINYQLISSKKIKKSKKNAMKYAKIDFKKSSYMVISNPQKFINPYLYYKLVFDFILYEEQELVIAEYSAINYFKIINGIEYNTKLNLLTMNLIDAPNVITCPWEYLYARQKSMNNKDSLEWAETIEEMHKSNEKLVDEIAQGNQNITPSSLVLTNDSKKIKEELIFGQPATISRYSLGKTGFSLKSVSITQEAIELMGYTGPLFRNIALKKGIPEIYPRLPSDCTAQFRKCLRKTLSPEISEEERPGLLVLKNGLVKFLKWKAYNFYHFDEKQNLNLELVITWNIDHNEPPIQGPIPHPDVDKELENYSLENEKFFEILSKETTGHHQKNTSQVCSYRELN